MQKPASSLASRTNSHKKVSQKGKSTSSSKNKQQNIKDFKLQIDHEIAKCLDTLDRQGLKYLRETLRASVIFGNDDSQQVKQVQQMQMQSQKKQNKSKRSSSKIQPQRKNDKNILHSKQVKQKLNKDKSKAQRVQVKNKQKKISAANKKAQSSSIKSQQSQRKKQENINIPEDDQPIQQQIEQQYDINQQQEVQEQNRTQVPSHRGDTLQTKQKYVSVPFQHKRFQPEKPISQPIRPFSKKNSRSKNIKQKQIIEEEKNQIKEQQFIEKVEIPLVRATLQEKQKTQIDIIVQKIIKMPQRKLKQLGKLIDRLENSRGQLDVSRMSQQSARPYMQSSNASHTRSGKFKKGQEKATSLHDQIMLKNKSKAPQEGTEHNNITIDKDIPDQSQLIPEEQIIQNQDYKQLQPSKQLSLRQNQVKLISHVSEPVTEISKKIESSEFQQFKNIQSPTKKQYKKKSSFMSKISGSSIFKQPLNIDITQSHQVQTVQLEGGKKTKKETKNQSQVEAQQEQNSRSQTKMMKLGKKKLGTNKVDILLLKNHGHSSIIGLTGIQFYNCSNKIIPINANNIIAPNGVKVLKLFNNLNLTTKQQNMFTAIQTESNKANILEYDIPEKIGGIKIWNYNKSQIESDKQTKEIQILINDKLVWKGQLKRGSYNEITQYATQIPIQDNFEFQHEQNQGFETIQKKQTDHKVENIEKVKKNSSIQPDSQLAAWLEQSEVTQKMKQLQQQEKQISKQNQQQPSFQRKIKEQKKQDIQEIQFKGMKKSQSQFQHSRIAAMSKRNLQQSPRKLQIKVQQKIKQTKQAKKSIQDQFDIFSSYGQSVIKQKNKPQLNQSKQQQNKLSSEEKVGVIESKDIIHQKKEQSSPVLKPNKPKTHQKSLQDFMNDSIFQDPVKPIQKNKIVTREGPSIPQGIPQKMDHAIQHKKIQMKKVKNTNQDMDLSQFLNELDDLVGEPIANKPTKIKKLNEDKKFAKSSAGQIPQNPKGRSMTIILESNWGDFQGIGLNKIQFFDSYGQHVYPSNILNTNTLKEMSLNKNSNPLVIFSQNNGNLTKQEQQWKSKYASGKPTEILVQFPKNIEFSLIRVWNYIGDRIHSGVGTKRLKILLQEDIIFSGDIKKSLGTSNVQIYKSYQCILFTNNIGTLKKIQSGDWLNREIESRTQERSMFKQSMKNFHRPSTKGSGSNKQAKVAQKIRQIKMPKRQCFEYDPPLLPKAYFIKIVMHTTWGDLNYIGLNGITVFDQQGKTIDILKNKVSEHPIYLSSLPGLENDKRNVKNLFNEVHFSEHQTNTWLAPYITDLQKLDGKDGKQPNTFLIELNAPCTISGINFYNYMKNPNRGVRQIEIFFDHTLVYRGYLRMLNVNGPEQTHTTIAFTKQQSLLQKMQFIGYHEDNWEQQVVFNNQGKIVK